MVRGNKSRRTLHPCRPVDGRYANTSAGRQASETHPDEMPRGVATISIKEGKYENILSRDIMVNYAKEKM
jgi:hypothetical protein